MKNLQYILTCLFSGLLFSCTNSSETTEKTSKVPSTYTDLVEVFSAWRTFENPPLHEGDPNYRKATFEKRLPDFEGLREKLLRVDTAS